MSMSREGLETIINRAGRIAVERDTLYRPIRSEDAVHMQPATESMNVVDDSLQETLRGNFVLSPGHLSQMAQRMSLSQVYDIARERSDLKKSPHFASTSRWDFTSVQELLKVAGEDHRLAEAGVTSVDESWEDYELGSDRLTELMTELQFFDIRSSNRVRLTASDGAIHWEGFCNQLSTIRSRRLQFKSEPTLTFAAKSDDETLITFADFAKALLLAHLALGPQATIRVDLNRTPILSPGSGKTSQNPAQKIISVLGTFGVSEVLCGALDPRLLEDLRAGSSQKSEDRQVELEVLKNLETLRHVPRAAV
jgi:hypothetical protein